MKPEELQAWALKTKLEYGENNCLICHRYICKEEPCAIARDRTGELLGFFCASCVATKTDMFGKSGALIFKLEDFIRFTKGQR